MNWLHRIQLGLLTIVTACVSTDFEGPAGDPPNPLGNIDWVLEIDWKENKGAAAFELWCAADQGNGLPRDAELAAEFLAIAVQEGDRRAVREHAWRQLQADGTDPRESMATLSSAGESGDPTAQFYLASISHKNGTMNNDAYWEITTAAAVNGSKAAQKALAKEWRTQRMGLWALLRFAYYRDAEADLILARAFETGDGLPRSAVEAYDAYRDASINESRAGTDAFLRLTPVPNVPTNSDNNYVRTLADRGVPEAVFLLGAELLLHPDLWDSVEDDARAMIRRAALSGESQRAIAMTVAHNGKAPHETASRKVRLGECYEQGWIGDAGPNRSRAAELYQQAAAMGSAEAMYLHARLEGPGPRALDGFLAAAEKGWVPAQCALGLAHSNSKRKSEYGHERSPATSVRWLERAAKAGYPRAQLELGRCFQQGYGVGRDADAAFEWYRKASRSPIAIKQPAPDPLWPESVRGEALLAFGLLTMSNPDSWHIHWYAGIRSLRMAYAEFKSADAAQAIGDAYAAGKGAPKQPGIAAAWHREAARLRKANPR